MFGKEEIWLLDGKGYKGHLGVVVESVVPSVAEKSGFHLHALCFSKRGAKVEESKTTY